MTLMSLQVIDSSQDAPRQEVRFVLDGSPFWIVDTVERAANVHSYSTSIERFYISDEVLSDPVPPGVMMFFAGYQPMVVQPDLNDSVHEALAGLRNIVGTIKEGRPLSSRTADFDNLLERASALQGKPENIEEWARQLAEDVGDLTD